MSKSDLNDPIDIAQRLDNHQATRFYWSLTILATIGGFLFGYDTANIGTVLMFFPYHLSTFALGYLAAGSSLGAAIGAIGSGPITDIWGRKALLVLDAAIYAVGAIVSGLAPNVMTLLISRTLIGLAIGADSAIATAYIAEYAPKDRRGKLAILQQWMITIGILLAYLTGMATLALWPHWATSFDWRLLLGLGAVPALIGLLYRVRMPESPRWLLRHGRYDKLQRVLDLLGIKVSREELKLAAQKEPVYHESRPREKRGVRRALWIAAIFMVFQQITGINVPFYYGPKILAPYFTPPHMSAVHAVISGIEATLVLAVVNSAATYIGFRYIDSFGRRPLAKTGFIGMAVFMALSAVTLVTLTGHSRALALVITLSGFIIFFAFGVGGTGWIIEGEYFPTAVRGRMAALVAFVNWMANFSVIELFPSLKNSVGLSGVMVIFSILAVLAVIFVSRSMPETKGLSVEEIAALFAHES